MLGAFRRLPDVLARDDALLPFRPSVQVGQVARGSRYGSSGGGARHARRCSCATCLMPLIIFHLFFHHFSITLPPFYYHFSSMPRRCSICRAFATMRHLHVAAR